MNTRQEASQQFQGQENEANRSVRISEGAYNRAAAGARTVYQGQNQQTVQAMRGKQQQELARAKQQKEVEKNIPESSMKVMDWAAKHAMQAVNLKYPGTMQFSEEGGFSFTNKGGPEASASFDLERVRALAPQILFTDAVDPALVSPMVYSAAQAILDDSMAATLGVRKDPDDPEVRGVELANNIWLEVRPQFDADGKVIGIANLALTDIRTSDSINFME